MLEVVAQIRSWGYAVSAAKEAQWTLCTLLLANGSPNLGDLSVVGGGGKGYQFGGQEGTTCVVTQWT